MPAGYLKVVRDDDIVVGYHNYSQSRMIHFSPRKPGGDGGGGSEGWDGMTPLHLACAQGQDQVVQCLVEYDADINAQVSGSLHGVHQNLNCICVW